MPSGAEALSRLRLRVDDLEAAEALSRGGRPAVPTDATALDAQADFLHFCLHFAASTPATHATGGTLAIGLPATKLRADTGAPGAATPTATAANARPAADGAVPTTRQLDLSRPERGDDRVRIRGRIGVPVRVRIRERIRARRADGGEEVEQETSLTIR